MYIKEITLFGFKSYKEKTTIKDLFNGFNVIVGRNGSGKSNLFAALEFALNVDLRPEAKSKSTVLSFGRAPGSDAAYIEIIFDNFDRKLMPNEETVVFRRILGAKKDRFIVNGKELSSVKQFLDAAGFTNPYFIVKQGKVQNLAVATDAQRLQAIFAVTGGRGYDDKIKDCRKSIADADAKREEVENMIEELKQRKQTLQEEVKGQKKFSKVDQTRRAIEHILHERKLLELQKKVDEVEARRKEGNAIQRPIREEIEKVNRNLQICKRDVGDMELQKKRIEKLMAEYEASRSEIVNTIAEKERELNDLMHGSDATFGTQSFETLTKDIAETETLLKEKEKQLEELNKNFQRTCQTKREYEAMMNVFAGQEVKKKDKKFVQDELKNSRQVLREYEEKAKGLQETLENAFGVLQKETTNLEKLKKVVTDAIGQIKITNEKLGENQSEELKLKTRLQAKWGDISESEQRCAEKRERLIGLDENFKKVHGAHVVEGLKGVKQIIQDFRSSGIHPEVVGGYYGLVCEKLQFEPMLDTAVEAAGGKKLSYHIVESTSVAKIILNEFNSRKYRGVVNFIPILDCRNQDSQSQGSFSPSGLQGAKPMMSVIDVVNDHFLPVAEFIFGKTFLCDTLQSATDTMRQFQCKCVTIDGDKVSKAGLMKGGYVPRNPQKLELQRAKFREEKELAEWTTKRDALSLDCDRLKTELRGVQQTILQCNTKIATLKTTKRNSLIAAEITEKSIISAKHTIETTERSLADCHSTIASAREKMSLLNGDKTLCDKAEIFKNLRKFSNEFAALKKECAFRQKERSVLEVKLQQLKKRYYDSLECSNNEEPIQLRIDRISELIDSLKRQKTGVESKIASSKTEMEKLQKLMSQKQKLVSEMKEQEVKLKEQFDKICSDLESHVDNLLAWQTKLREHIASAENLGSVPQNVEKYASFQDRDLYEKLKKAKFLLKALSDSGVNQNALQQLKELEENLTGFETRLESSSAEREELLLFLEDLETRRGETLLQNIRVLQEQFRSIFCSIVPRGNAELVVYANDVNLERDRNLDSEDLRDVARRNLFEGTKIHVNFTGRNFHPSRTLESLSGGQKSIVALCLILALQTIDPAPFYLFDEVDQALDSRYRESVAKEIGKMSEKPRQFICTTFRREFVSVADKLYGVSFQHMCSTIKPISENQALEFVDETESDMTSAESAHSPVVGEARGRRNSSA